MKKLRVFLKKIIRAKRVEIVDLEGELRAKALSIRRVK